MIAPGCPLRDGAAWSYWTYGIASRKKTNTQKRVQGRKRRWSSEQMVLDAWRLLLPRHWPMGQLDGSQMPAVEIAPTLHVPRDGPPLGARERGGMRLHSPSGCVAISAPLSNHHSALLHRPELRPAAPAALKKRTRIASESASQHSLSLWATNILQAVEVVGIDYIAE